MIKLQTEEFHLVSLSFFFLEKAKMKLTHENSFSFCFFIHNLFFIFLLSSPFIWNVFFHLRFNANHRHQHRDIDRHKKFLALHFSATANPSPLSFLLHNFAFATI